MQTKIADESKFNEVIRSIKEQQKVIAAVKNAPYVVLNQLHTNVLKLVGTVDTLRSLELLEDDTYQELVEKNVAILEKLETKMTEIKRSLVVCQPVRLKYKSTT